MSPNAMITNSNSSKHSCTERKADPAGALQCSRAGLTQEEACPVQTKAEQEAKAKSNAETQAEAKEKAIDNGKGEGEANSNPKREADEVSCGSNGSKIKQLKAFLTKNVKFPTRRSSQSSSGGSSRLSTREPPSNESPLCNSHESPLSSSNESPLSSTCTPSPRDSEFENLSRTLVVKLSRNAIAPADAEDLVTRYNQLKGRLEGFKERINSDSPTSVQSLSSTEEAIRKGIKRIEEERGNLRLEFESGAISEYLRNKRKAQLELQEAVLADMSTMLVDRMKDQMKDLLSKHEPLETLERRSKALSGTPCQFYRTPKRPALVVW